MQSPAGQTKKLELPLYLFKLFLVIRPGFELLLQFLLVLSYMRFVNEPLLLEILLRSKSLPKRHH